MLDATAMTIVNTRRGLFSSVHLVDGDGIH